MAQKLAAELGLGVGISPGANFLGALLVQDELGEDAAVVTVFPDDNKKYSSTDLLRDEPLKSDFLAPDVTLVSMRASSECVTHVAIPRNARSKAGPTLRKNSCRPVSGEDCNPFASVPGTPR